MSPPTRRLSRPPRLNPIRRHRDEPGRALCRFARAKGRLPPPGLRGPRSRRRWHLDHRHELRTRRGECRASCDHQPCAGVGAARDRGPFGRRRQTRLRVFRRRGPDDRWRVQHRRMGARPATIGVPRRCRHLPRVGRRDRQPDPLPLRPRDPARPVHDRVADRDPRRGGHRSSSDPGLRLHDTRRDALRPRKSPRAPRCATATPSWSSWPGCTGRRLRTCPTP